MPCWVSWVQEPSGLIKMREEVQPLKVESGSKECLVRANICNKSESLQDNNDVV